MTLYLVESFLSFTRQMISDHLDEDLLTVEERVVLSSQGAENHYHPSQSCKGLSIRVQDKYVPFQQEDFVLRIRDFTLRQNRNNTIVKVPDQNRLQMKRLILLQNLDLLGLFVLCFDTLSRISLNKGLFGNLDFTKFRMYFSHSHNSLLVF